MIEEFENNIPSNTQEPSEAKTTRRLRSADSRNFESRSASERPPIAYGLLSRFNISKEIIKSYADQGYELNWVMYSSGNVEQKENYFSAIERNHIPVLASEHPEFRRNYDMNPFGEKNPVDQFISKGGQILMKRKEEYCAAEREHYDSENRRQDFMTEMHRMSAQNPGSVRPFIDERKRERVH